MAVKIPVYEQRTTPEGFLQVSPNVVPMVSAGEWMGAEIGQAAQRIGHAAGQFSDALVSEYETTQNREAAVRVGDGVSQATLDWTRRLQEAKVKAPLGASGFTDSLMEEYTKFADQSISNEQNEHGKQLLHTGLNNLKERLFSNALTFEQQSRTTLQSQQLDSTVENWSKLVYQDPSQYGTAKTELMRTIANMDGLDATEKVKILEKRLPEIAQYATQGFINQDPKAAYKTIKQDDAYSPGFDGAVTFTLKHEGGLNPSDSNGSPSNFGINQKAHPGIDVKNISQDQAKDIYRKEYWNAIGGDKLAAQNPKLAMAAFDTAVMSGVGKAKSLLEKADGDAAKFMELRSDFLQGLLKSNPEKYGKYAAAWNSRNRELRNQMLPEGVPHITGQPFVDDLPADKMWTYQRAAETRYNQQVAVDTQQFKSNLANSVAMYADGVMDPKPLQRDQFLTAFGEEEGARQFDQYQQTQQMGQHISEMQSMPLSTIGQLLEESKPQPGANYQEADKRHSLLAQAAARTVKLREDDPAAYVLKTSQPVRDAYSSFSTAIGNQALSEDVKQAAARRYADASMAEQVRLSVSSPALLSKPYIESVANQYAVTTDPEATVAGMKSMAQLWGNDYWPKVYKELHAAKALSPTALVIGSGVGDKTAKDLVIASQIKPEDMLKGVPDAKIVKQDVTMAVSDALEPFRQSMIGADGKQLTLGGANTFNTFYDQISNLAMYYRSQGMTAKDAAQKASDGVINDRYSFVDVNGPYRVPKEFDVDKVTEAANHYLDTIDPENLRAPMTSRKDSMVAYDMAQSIKAHGHWVTAPDESGLVLFDDETRAPVLDKAGKPIQYTWQKLQEYTKPSSYKFGSGKMFD